VVGHGDRAEAVALGVRDQVRRLDRAVVRVARVHVQVGDDPVPVGEGLRLVPPMRAPAAAGVLVEAIEPLGDVVERSSGRGRPASEGVLRSRRLVVREPEQRRRGELGLRGDVRRVDDRAARGRGLVTQSLQAVGRGNDDRRRPEDLRPRLAGDARSHVDAVAQPDRDRRPRREPGRAEDDRLPALQPAQGAQGGADNREPARRGLDHDAVPLRRGREELGIDPSRDNGECPGETLPRARRDVVVRRDQGVDAGEQTVALRLARREPEALGVDERRGGRRLRLEQCDVRQAGNAGIEAVDDVEVTGAEGRRDTRADADGDTDGGTRGDRDRPGQRDDAVERACLQRSAAREEVRGAGRRREDDDRVAASPERVRDARDVFVRRVRHRPGVRRHEAEAERHGPGL
jgi:hypothetical protein